jgi:hypothetical protein
MYRLMKILDLFGAATQVTNPLDAASIREAAICNLRGLFFSQRLKAVS